MIGIKFKPNQSDIQNLKRAGDRLGEAITKGLAKGADVLKKSARNKVAVKTGRLKTSIFSYSRRGYIMLGATQPYAYAQEYGKPGGNYKFTPYLGPALRENEQKILDLIDEEILRSWEQG